MAQPNQPGDVTDKQWRAAAKRQGYQFFKVGLKRNTTQKVKIWGVQDLRFGMSVPTQTGQMADFQFVQTGGQAKFEYDEERYGYYADILDDQDGHNREFFASCWDDGDYDIEDAAIKADVEKRAAEKRVEKKEDLKEEQAELDKKINGPATVMSKVNPKKEIIVEKKEDKDGTMFPCPVCAQPVRRDTNWCPQCCKNVKQE